MTGTADRRGPGEERWPQEPPQQPDEWGRPQPAAPYGGVPQQSQYGYDGYGQQQAAYPEQQQYEQQQQYGQSQYADPRYADPQFPQQPQQGYQQGYPQAFDQGYGQDYQQGYDQSYGQSYDDRARYAVPEQQYREPGPAPAADPEPRPERRSESTTRPRPAAAAPGTESVPDEFAFVDDAEESADVIDWMKFSETRGERRDERRKQLRTRFVAAAVAVVLLAGGGVGYLWADGKLFGASTVAASTTRTVVAVHLHDIDKHVYTALLVSDPGAGKGTTVLLPGTLGVPAEGSSSALALNGSVDSQGNAATRDGLNTLLGANVTATWGLYTPFLQNLVDVLGGIQLDADATVVVGGKTVVSPGKATVNGAAAIAYAVYRAPGESADAQLARFGQVLAGLIQAMPQDPTSAAGDITRMGAVPDPSLPDASLGALLAAMSKDANAGKYSTQTLGVKSDGTLAPGADTLVKQLLGGSVNAKGSMPTVARVAVQDATGVTNRANLADAAVINGGFTLVPGTPKADSNRATSTVSYTDDTRAADARQVAQDLGLPATAVRKVTTAQSVDVMVVLGKDFTG